MSFFVVRATAASGVTSQDRADVFARGETAVLVVADGAGGRGDGAVAADAVLEHVRDVVLDPTFDLARPTSWCALFLELDRSIAAFGETTAVVVVLAPGMLLHVHAGDSEAWIVRDRDVEPLTRHGEARARLGSNQAKPFAAVRGGLDGRLVVATDGLFRHAAADDIVALARRERFGGLADALVALPRLPSGAWPDDVAVLAAEV